jgi:glycosyltransferase involved in cell wall biosynthesis
MRVSALTIIHNRADLFAETIRSVLEQSYPVHELIVIDDGSTEDVKAVTDSFNDPRIRYFYVKRIGVISKLRNLALSKSTGEVMAFIDSDDLWHRDKIKLHMEAMQMQQAELIFSDCQLFNTEGPVGPTVAKKLYGKEVNIFKTLTEHNQSLAFGSNLFFKKHIGGQPVQFDERLFVGEHDLIVRLSATYKCAFIPQVLNYIRRHNRNTSVEHSVLDLIGPLEYNRTIDKLKASQLITPRLYKKIKAANYSKAAGYHLYLEHYRKSRRYLCLALGLDFRWYYLRILLKVWRTSLRG